MRILVLLTAWHLGAQVQTESIHVTLRSSDQVLAVLQASAGVNVASPQDIPKALTGRSCGRDCTWAWSAASEVGRIPAALHVLEGKEFTESIDATKHIFPPQPAETSIASDSVDIVCNSISTLTPLILGKQVAKIADTYLCFVTNNSAESVMLGEGALLRRVPQLLPYDRATFSLALSRVVTTSVAERIIRILADPTQLFLLFGAAKIITMPFQLLTGLAAYNAEVPYIQQRIHGVELPIVQNYQSLVINGSLHVAAGDTAITHIFGVPQGMVGPGYARASIPVHNAPLVRSIQ